MGDIEHSMETYNGLRSRFAAAVLFPHDLGMISFDDLYAIGMPLFMPETDLIASLAYGHVVTGENYPWYLIREEHADLNYQRAEELGVLPWDPGWDGRQALH